MQSIISARCGNAVQILLHKMMPISSYSSTDYCRQFLRRSFSDDLRSCLFTRQFSLHRRNPWEVPRKSTRFFEQLNAFVSDAPVRKTGSTPNGYASLTTSSDNDAKGKKLNKKWEESQEQILLQKESGSIMLKFLVH
ncbi:hypothetical protein HanIR_Chr11g0531881 [Helianthus annuus]|nr:hypothetical protein HanIR_Chr11g0531881 [Helianthus annuus]